MIIPEECGLDFTVTAHIENVYEANPELASARAEYYLVYERASASMQDKSIPLEKRAELLEKQAIALAELLQRERTAFGID
jgi:hypothetical protein